ncbi:hypothetical protein BH09VER1_BH09VER1_31680 [soil metagenome]
MKTLLIAIASLFTAAAGLVAQETPAVPVDPIKPNHTKAVQSSDPDAVKMSATILHMIDMDRSLSFAAKNVKVITTGKGKVVLHGSVKSLQESTTIEGYAIKAGAKKVSNKLDVE